MFEYTLVSIIMAFIMSFVIFFLLDKLIIKLFKLSEIPAAIIAFIATVLLNTVLEQDIFNYIFTAAWFIVALIAINIDKKKEAEQKTE